MNCNAVQTRLSAYLDRELNGTELLELRAHLSECPECRAEEIELRSLKAILGNLSAPPPSEDFADRLCATVLRESYREEPRWTWKRSAFTFAGVAAASMILTFFTITIRSNASAKPQSKSQDLAFDVASDQAYSMGADATEGAPGITVASYAGR